jgi:hypothetical protein
LSSEDHSSESIEVGVVGSGILGSEFLGESGLGPSLSQTEGFDVFGKKGFSLVSHHSFNPEFGEHESLGWDNLSVNAGGWASNQDLNCFRLYPNKNAQKHRLTSRIGTKKNAANKNNYQY